MEINNTLEGSNSKIIGRRMEDRMMEITATEPNIDKRMKKRKKRKRRQCKSPLWTNIKHINICIIEKREGARENI